MSDNRPSADFNALSCRLWVSHPLIENEAIRLSPRSCSAATSAILTSALPRAGRGVVMPDPAMSAAISSVMSLASPPSANRISIIACCPSSAAPDVRPLSAEETAKARNWLRVACAAEMAGLMQAALDATVEHTSVRKQFGRPLGTFQALRHRMAECAVLVAGVRRLALQAAWSGDAGDAALAALTTDAAAMLGVSSTLGSIETGKLANLILTEAFFAA